MVVGKHQVFQSNFYGGSRLLLPLAEATGLSIDQVNFVTCQLGALAFAFPFRKYLTPEKVSVTGRHLIEILVGVFLGSFCFGYQVCHLLIQSVVSYALMSYGGSRFSHTLVFFWCLFYLSVCHIYRMTYDYGGWTMDITGPLMIQTQKITALAFALHDGRYKDQDNLTQDQRSQAVRKLPNLLEYMSFMFYFHGIMVGPNTFYKDYIAFIDGSNMKVQGRNTESNSPEDERNPTKNLNKIVAKKMLIAAVCAASMLYMPDIMFNPEVLDSPTWYSMNFWYKSWFLVGCLTLAKNKYYFAWKFADAVNNAAGFGFSGYDDQGNALWDLTDNVDIKGVELSTSLKINIDSWNKKTLLWLRRVVYDRVPTQATLAVFATSALWHGFYPGYYITFFGGAFCISASRLVRRNIRPLFQTSGALRWSYDAVTFTLTRIANAYLCFPFLVLEAIACFRMYQSMYFYLHIGTAIIYGVMILYAGSKKQKSSAPAASASQIVQSAAAQPRSEAHKQKPAEPDSVQQSDQQLSSIQSGKTSEVLDHQANSKKEETALSSSAE